MKKRVLTAIFTVLLAALLALPALAAEPVGYVERSWNGTQVVSTDKTADTYTELTAATTEWTDGNTYVAKGDITVSDRIVVTGTVNLILTDGCILRANAGVGLDSGNTLQIYAQTGGTGQLIANPGWSVSAGIGGTNVRKSGGTLTIHGGSITAYGGENGGAGIGGASAGNTSALSGSTFGAGCNMTVYGGTVTATGGYGGNGNNSPRGGAGIGGGGGSHYSFNRGGDGGTLTVYGGQIHAAGQRFAAGIGAGAAEEWQTERGGSGATVAVYGGTVYASSERGSAIGGTNGNHGSKSFSNCVVFEGNTGTVYPASGSDTCTLAADFTIPAGKSITVGAGTVLSVPAGVTLTNNGTLTIQDANRLTGNGTITGSGKFALPLSSSDITVPALLTYNGQAQPVEIQCAVTPVTIMGQTFYPFGMGNLPATYSLNGQTVSEVKDAGNYMVTVVGTFRKTFTVQKAQLMNVTAPVAADLTYNGQEQVLLTAHASAQGYNSDTATAEYSLDGGATWSAEFPKAKDAGTHAVMYRLNAGNNYEIASGNIQVELKPKEVGLQWSALTAQELVYSGSGKELTATATGLEPGDACDVQVAANGDNLNAGTFRFEAVTLSNANYKLPADVSSPTYTITKVPVYITALDKQIRENEKLPELSAPVQGTDYEVAGLVNGETLPITVSMTYDSTVDNTKEGEYGILTSGDAESTNYVYTYLPGKLVVKHIAYITYEMRSSTTAGGTISPKGTWYVEPYGSKTYTITPDSGYAISDVLVDGKSVGAVSTYTFSDVSKYHTIHVIFESSAGRTLPFTDVVKADWFYPHLENLYFRGIVSGMTPTAFAPKGTLTYGQAMKLLTVGLGHGEQAGDTKHWASGYLTFAKSKGWLAEDVDLDAPISRLAFCQMAAKAKSLTAPAASKFTDCSDVSVLALVKVGVIDGMTETTFQPDATLTRAQITKIIDLLIKL